MSEVVGRAGIAGAYLNRRQMGALEALIARKGVSRGQVMKEIVVEALVEEGLLPEAEMFVVRQKQEYLKAIPHGNSKRFRSEMAERAAEREQLERQEESRSRSARRRRRPRMEEER
jgi:hypothetical protein